MKAKHKTVPKELKKSMNWIEAQGAKLVLGICECSRHKFPAGHIRLLRKEAAGIKSVGYTGNGIMNFFIVCKNEDVYQAMINKFGEPAYPQMGSHLDIRQFDKSHSKDVNSTETEL